MVGLKTSHPNPLSRPIHVCLNVLICTVIKCSEFLANQSLALYKEPLSVVDGDAITTVDLSASPYTGHSDYPTIAHAGHHGYSSTPLYECVYSALASEATVYNNSSHNTVTSWIIIFSHTHYSTSDSITVCAWWQTCACNGTCTCKRYMQLKPYKNWNTHSATIHYYILQEAMLLTLRHQVITSTEGACTVQPDYMQRQSMPILHMYKHFHSSWHRSVCH